MFNKLKEFSFFFLLFFLIRLILIFYFPADHELKYELVATNILSGCGVSFSLPNSNECIHAFGPNGPGYPFFLAFLKFFYDNDTFIKIFQIFIYFISILFVKKSIYQYSKSNKLSNIIFIILSVSPLTLAWSRFVLPETIMISLSLFFVGFVIKSLVEKKFFTIEFSLIFTLMTFFRTDSIFFIFPIIYLIFISHKFDKGIKKLLIFIIIFSLPWGLWTYRNLSKGANIFPNIYESYETITKKKFPFGYNKWVFSWAHQQYEFADALNPTHLGSDNKDNSFKYGDIKINDKIYFDKKEKQNTKKLLNNLKLYSGKSFPLDIDKKFEDLANLRINENKLFSYFVVPIKRSINLWFNPFYSHGWPIELSKKLTDKKIDYYNKSLIEKISLIKIFPVEIFLKIIFFLWIFFLFIFFIMVFFQKKNQNNQHFFKICFQLILIKTIFFGYTGFFETRYIVNLIPIIEILIILVLNKALKNN